MVSLRWSMRNLLGAGLFHLVEQQLGALSLDCAYERVRDTKLEVVRTWYLANLGIDLASLPSWAAIDKLRLVANSVKHAEGPSAKNLRVARPDLFSNPDFAMASEDLFVTEAHLKAYADAARSLFEELIEFCEAHQDDRFPLSA